MPLYCNFLEKWLNIYDYEEFKLTAPFKQNYHNTSGYLIYLNICLNKGSIINQFDTDTIFYITCIIICVFKDTVEAERPVSSMDMGHTLISLRIEMVKRKF